MGCLSCDYVTGGWRFSCWWKEQPRWAREPGRGGNFSASWRWQPARQGSQSPSRVQFPLSCALALVSPCSCSHLFNILICTPLLRSHQWLPIPERPGPRALIWFSALTNPLTHLSHHHSHPPDPLGRGPFSELDIILSSLGSCSLSRAFPFPPKKIPQLLAQKSPALGNLPGSLRGAGRGAGVGQGREQCFWLQVPHQASLTAAFRPRPHGLP